MQMTHESSRSPLGERTQTVLSRLHEDAKRDKWKMLRGLPKGLLAMMKGQSFWDAVPPESMKDVYIPVDPDKGMFLYLTARALGAKRIVEFGTSFGISTIYLGAAARDNGGGRVISSEIESSKVQTASKNIHEAGLSDYVVIKEGDARQTLKEVEAPVDMVLLDGWQNLYLPVLKVLMPKIRPGAVVFAEDIFTFKKTLRPYVEYVQNPKNGFISNTLSMSHGFEYSVYCG